jgi:hypothetical protein
VVRYGKKWLAGIAVALTAGGLSIGLAPLAHAAKTIGSAIGTAQAAPMVTASTHVTNHPDSGAGGNTWAYDDFTRKLTLSRSSHTTSCTHMTGYAPGDDCYTATVTDKGQFHAILGVDSPNQSTAGVKVAHAVTGSMNGGAAYIVAAPHGDAPDALRVETAQNDNFADPSGDHTTTDWPQQAFAVPGTVLVAYADAGNGWSWTYTTACQSWTDAGTNSGGSLPGDGNITGKACARPYTYDGHVISVSNNDAEIGWKDGPGVHYVLTRTFGYGFSSNGSPHLGFTGGTIGYWEGLAAGHTYDIELIPAGMNRQPLPHAQVGWITIVTTR